MEYFVIIFDIELEKLLRAPFIIVGYIFQPRWWKLLCTKCAAILIIGGLVLALIFQLPYSYNVFGSEPSKWRLFSSLAYTRISRWK